MKTKFISFLTCILNFWKNRIKKKSNRFQKKKEKEKNENKN